MIVLDSIHYFITFICVGILYCLSQKESEEMCRNLNASGIQAGCYHAGMTSHDRTESHMNWIDNKIQVVHVHVVYIHMCTCLSGLILMLLVKNSFNR